MVPNNLFCHEGIQMSAMFCFLYSGKIAMFYEPTIQESQYCHPHKPPKHSSFAISNALKPISVNLPSILTIYLCSTIFWHLIYSQCGIYTDSFPILSRLPIQTCFLILNAVAIDQELSSFPSRKKRTPLTLIASLHKILIVVASRSNMSRFLKMDNWHDYLVDTPDVVCESFADIQSERIIHYEFIKLKVYL